MGCFSSIHSRRSSKGSLDTDDTGDVDHRAAKMSPVTPLSPASSLRMDPEFLKAIEPLAGLPQPHLATVADLRKYTDELLHTVFRLQPTPEAIVQTSLTVRGPAGHAIPVVRFATPAQLASKTPQPAVVYAHGGGMVCGSVAIFAPELARHAHAAGVQLWAVDYRLAPEHPAPAGVDDMYAVLAWLSAHGFEHAVDPARLCVAGDSAGGGLAAGVCLMARDRGLSPPVAKQVLVYPMLDDRTVADAAYGEGWGMRKFLTWKCSDNALAWAAYVGADKAGKPGADVSVYAAPARAGSLAGLPPTYIDVGGLDLFRDEDTDYAARLARANVEVEFHIWPGVPHGFDSQSAVPVARAAREARSRALGSGY